MIHGAPHRRGRARSWRSQVADRRGLSTVEYVVIAALIACASLAAWKTFGGEVDQRAEESGVAVRTLEGDGTPGATPSTDRAGAVPGVGRPTQSVPSALVSLGGGDSIGSAAGDEPHVAPYRPPSGASPSGGPGSGGSGEAGETPAPGFPGVRSVTYKPNHQAFSWEAPSRAGATPPADEGDSDANSARYVPPEGAEEEEGGWFGWLGGNPVEQPPPRGRGDGPAVVQAHALFLPGMPAMPTAKDFEEFEGSSVGKYLKGLESFAEDREPVLPAGPHDTVAARANNIVRGVVNGVTDLAKDVAGGTFSAYELIKGQIVDQAITNAVGEAVRNPGETAATVGKGITRGVNSAGEYLYETGAACANVDSERCFRGLTRIATTVPAAVLGAINAARGTVGAAKATRDGLSERFRRVRGRAGDALPERPHSLPDQPNTLSDQPEGPPVPEPPDVRDLRAANDLDPTAVTDQPEAPAIPEAPAASPHSAANDPGHLPPEVQTLPLAANGGPAPTQRPTLIALQGGANPDAPRAVASGSGGSGGGSSPDPRGLTTEPIDSRYDSFASEPSDRAPVPRNALRPPPAPANPRGPAPSGPDVLGRGAQMTTRHDGRSHVRKRVDSIIGFDRRDPPIYWRLSDEDRSQLARHLAEKTNELRNVRGLRGAIPELEVVGPGELRQKRVTGLTFEELRAQDPARAELAAQARAEMVRRARARLGEGTASLGDGWTVEVDPSLENFRFDANGRVKAWFDPVLVLPPDDRLIGPGGGLLVPRGTPGAPPDHSVASAPREDADALPTARPPSRVSAERSGSRTAPPESSTATDAWEENSPFARAPVAPEPGARFVGQGVTAQVHQVGNDAVKQVKEFVGSREHGYWRLDDQARDQMASRTVQSIKGLRESNEPGLGRDIIPHTWKDGEGRYRQRMVDGDTYDQLSDEAKKRADEETKRSIAAARRHVGITDPEREDYVFLPDEDGVISDHDSWRRTVDTNLQNFRFNPDGTIRSWFDPVVEIPPERMVVRGGDWTGARPPSVAPGSGAPAPPTARPPRGRGQRTETAEPTSPTETTGSPGRSLGPDEVWVSNPDRIQAVRSADPDEHRWNLVDSETGLSVGHFEVEVDRHGRPTGGPEFRLDVEPTDPATGRRRPLRADFSFTRISLERAIDVYRREFGGPPPSLDGRLTSDNLRNFQLEYARIRDANPGMSPDEIARQATGRISYGRHRVDVGYGELGARTMGRQDLEWTDPATGRREILRDVPVSVDVTARPTRAGPPSAAVEAPGPPPLSPAQERRLDQLTHDTRPISGEPLSAGDRELLLNHAYPETIERYNQRLAAGHPPVTPETPVYRYSADPNGLGGQGVTWWSTEAPIAGTNEDYLFRSTVGELRRKGAQLRVDRAEEGLAPGSVSIVAVNEKRWDRVPGTNNRLEYLEEDYEGNRVYTDRRGNRVDMNGRRLRDD